MILLKLNYLAVAVSALAYFVLGAIYFNPKVVGAAWMKGHNLGQPTEEDRKGMGKLMATTFVLCFVGAIGIACLMSIVQPTTWLVGAKIGLLASVFASIAIAMSYMYTKKSVQIIMIDCGYHIIGLVLTSEVQMAFL